MIASIFFIWFTPGRKAGALLCVSCDSANARQPLDWRGCYSTVRANLIAAQIQDCSYFSKDKSTAMPQEIAIFA
ncbi:MAG: hypothetical protein ACLPJJ_12235 [Acidocella sp.]|uniref:hypothetical protein n=1 Tax=Acidocella sp. TaxID=50710 RepID=UPI003FC54BF0